MKNISFLSLLLASMLVTGCAFENKTEALNPLAPSGTGGQPTSSPAGSPGGSGSSSSSGATAVSAFLGAWGSSSIAGLPIGNCGDVKWLITEQSASSVSGTVSASCANGVKVDANLTGTIKSENVISLVATGTITALGLPCQVSLNATGTRQAGDTMRVDYNGTYCFGTVSGSETLRKFPNI